MTDTPTAYGFSMTIPSTFDWYCPHCGKRKDGGPDDYVIEHMHGMKPLVYGLCKDCAVMHHLWMEGVDTPAEPHQELPIDPKFYDDPKVKEILESKAYKKYVEMGCPPYMDMKDLEGSE